MKANQPVQLSHGSGNEDGEAPADYRPDPAEGQAESDPADAGEEPPQGGRGDIGNEDNGEDVPGQGTEDEPGSKNDPGSTSKDGKSTNGKKAVLIYHSHPQEAYNPLLTHPSDNPGRYPRARTSCW